MPNKKTLYIIGAGASKEVNLPTGAQLKNEISQLLDIRFDGYSQTGGDKLINSAYTIYASQNDGDINSLQLAGWRIRDAMPQAISIDNFIDTHKEDKKIELCGKLAIVRSILEAEKNSLLYINSSNENKINFQSVESTWYSSFMMLLTENCSIENLKERLDSISFIIFNYDRCIEHFIYNSLQNYYGISPTESATFINNLDIYHPYGTVGNLPWKNGHSVSFGATPNAHQLLELASQIKTFTEGTNPKSSEIIAIRKNVAKSETIVFLGFAYHKQNMLLISPNSLSSEKFGSTDYFGTAYQISDSDCKIIESEISQFKETDIYVRNINNKLACKDLFKEYWRSLSLN